MTIEKAYELISEAREISLTQTSKKEEAGVAANKISIMLKRDMSTHNMEELEKLLKAYWRNR